MEVYRFKGPDGQIHRARAASPEEAKAGLEKMWADRANTGRVAAQKDARTRVRNTPAVIRALNAGAWANWADDLDAWGAGVETGLNNKVRSLVGKEALPYTPEEARAAVLAANKEGDEQFRQDHPWLSTGSNILGAVFGPGSKMAGRYIGGGATMMSRAKRAALVAGGYGGAAGAGNAENDRVGGFVGGALMGAPAGFVGVPVLEKTLPPMARAVERVAIPAMGRMAEAMPNLAAQLDRATGGASTRRVNRQPLSEDEYRVAKALEEIRRDDLDGGYAPGGGPAMYDRGPNMQTTADVLVQSGGPGGARVRARAEEVKANEQPDLRADLAQGLGGRGDYWETLETMQKGRRKAADDSMGLIGDRPIMLDENSVAALRSERARSAMAEAVKNALASEDEAVRHSGVALQRLMDDLGDTPGYALGPRAITVRQAQDISESLLKAADAAFKSSTVTPGLGPTLKSLGRAVRTNARTPDRGGLKEYDDFLKQYATDMEIEGAYELGSNVLKNGLDNSAEFVRRELDEAGPGAMAAYRKGVAEQLLNTVMDTGDLRVLRNLLKNENFKQRLRLAFPDDASFVQFLDAAEERVMQANLNNRYAGGSPTYLRQAMRQRLEGEGYDLSDLMDDVTSPRAAAGRVTARILQGRGGILTDPKRNAILGGALLDDAEMSRLLNGLQTGQRIQGAISRSTAPIGGSTQNRP